MKTCETCKWWHDPAYYLGSMRGDCRRYPPQIVIKNFNTTGTEFPSTTGPQFCGEHQPKDKAR